MMTGASNLQMKMIFALAVLLAAMVATVVAPLPASAMKAPVYTGLVSGVGAGGYDVVAYFTDKKPVKGGKEFTHSYDGAVWRFSSAANRDAFAAEPAKYAPQYGGYCAWAVSQGYTAEGDPNAWSVFNGKLYLNYNISVRATWSKDKAGNVVKGDKNWPSVLN